MRKLRSFLEGFHQKPVPLEPFRPPRKVRPRCPFYGFSHPWMGGFLDQEGNQCPLILDRYSPCYMEMEGREPEWANCNYNSPANQPVIQRFKSEFRFYPKEFWPFEQASWEGITGKEWMAYIEGRPTA